MNLALYLQLVRLSLTDPNAAAFRVTTLLDTAKARWLALAAVVTTGAALGAFAELLFSFMTGTDLGPAASPVKLGIVQAVLLIYAAGAMTLFGRQFGGTGRFGDALSLVVWIEAVMVGGQILQLLLMVLFPLVSVVLTLALFALMLWLLVRFTATLHGFENLFLTAAGVLAVFFGSAMVLGALILGLGISPSFLAES
ncbi:YIP1 family protein [Rhodobacter maris]|uniref:Yip1-like protein n=1 Tax=Rhodobacter maris TaxID=446682 RepID=A0A285RVJ0_9RHOB|nr:YIP1 family protein [Rhodobacter maris]SOB98532.1 Yip1-like protein [Rhodobacter maris]